MLWPQASVVVAAVVDHAVVVVGRRGAGHAYYAIVRSRRCGVTNYKISSCRCASTCRAAPYHQ